MKMKIKMRMLGAVILLFALLVGRSAKAQRNIVTNEKWIYVDFEDKWLVIDTEVYLHVGDTIGYSYGDTEVNVVEDRFFHVYSSKDPLMIQLRKEDIKGIRKKGIGYVRIKDKFYLISDNYRNELMTKAKNI